MDMHSADHLVMCLGDFNGHIGICIVLEISSLLSKNYPGRHTDGFHMVHGGYCVGQRYLEGRALLQCGLEKDLYVKYVVKERGKEEGDILNGR